MDQIGEKPIDPSAKRREASSFKGNAAESIVRAYYSLQKYAVYAGEQGSPVDIIVQRGTEPSLKISVKLAGSHWNSTNGWRQIQANLMAGGDTNDSSKGRLYARRKKRPHSMVSDVTVCVHPNMIEGWIIPSSALESLSTITVLSGNLNPKRRDGGVTKWDQYRVPFFPYSDL